MVGAFRFLLKFWKPIATGVGSIMAWESVDDVVAPEEKNQKVSGLTLIVSAMALVIIGMLTGIIKVKKRRK